MSKPRLGGGVEIGAVNEQCDFFRFGFHDQPPPRLRHLRAFLGSPEGGLSVRYRRFCQDQEPRISGDADPLYTRMTRLA